MQLLHKKKEEEACLQPFGQPGGEALHVELGARAPLRLQEYLVRLLGKGDESDSARNKGGSSIVRHLHATPLRLQEDLVRLLGKGDESDSARNKGGSSIVRHLHATPLRLQEDLMRLLGGMGNGNRGMKSRGRHYSPEAPSRGAPPAQEHLVRLLRRGNPMSK